jgi:hypothetical protein
MKHLRLIPGTHRQLPILWANFATRLLEKEVILKHIQTFLEHNGSKTKERYTQISTQEIGIISNPLDTFHNLQSGTIATAAATIEPFRQRDKKNKRPGKKLLKRY